MTTLCALSASARTKAASSQRMSAEVRCAISSGCAGFGVAWLNHGSTSLFEPPGRFRVTKTGFDSYHIVLDILRVLGMRGVERVRLRDHLHRVLAQSQPGMREEDRPDDAELRQRHLRVGA